MNRVIRFRGKSIENKNIGEWVVGDLHLLSPFAHIHTGTGTKCKIDPDTVGQFTGFKDDDGKDVYEGDIVVELDFSFKSKPYVVKYDVDYGAFKFFGSGNGSLLSLDFLDMKVIGNIHDNPELLKS